MKIILLVIITLLVSCNKLKFHSCNWVDCELVGKTNFIPTWKGEDGRSCQKLHWEHPEWIYEQCEQIILNK